MTFVLTLQDAQAQFPNYKFVKALTPSAQKAAFHVRDQNENDLCLKIVTPTYERDRLDREILAMQMVDQGGALYQRRAFSALPLLVRQAEAGQTIHYEQLASELGMPNPRKPGITF